MKTYPFYLIPILILFSSLNVYGQKTGSFDETIVFNSKDRTLACYVPTNYNANNSYQLIIALHGLGDSASNYRNALINSRNWQNVFTQTIFICPDGGDDQNSDFYSPAGDEQIIQKAIDFAKANYSIDNNDIILQGFSLGGRSALKYGLVNHGDFNGLMLSTPAMQGIADVQNTPALAFGFDYALANQIPIFISFGASDQLYEQVIDMTIDSLIQNDGILSYEKVSGLGHSLANNTVITKAKDFFANPSIAGLDAEIRKVQMPSLSCDSILTPMCLILNAAASTITEMEIQYKVGSNTQSYTWNGTLDAYDHAMVTLPQITSVSGKQTIEVTILSVNGGGTELSTSNNAQSTELYVGNQTQSFPLMVDFEGQNDAWTLDETGSLFMWYLDDEVGHNSSYSMATFNTLLVFYTAGYEESFKSPVLDLTSSTAPSLAFDVAFNYHKYTPPYFTADVFFADTLIVSISTDCGQNYIELYRKGGADLATVDSPIVNPLSVTDCIFTPKANEWRTDAINLGAYKNEKEAIIKFSYKSALGGSIYIDNIRLDKSLSIKEDLQETSFSIFPNPARQSVNIQFDTESEKQVKVYDALGRVMKSFATIGDYQLDISQYSQGMYSIEVIENGKRQVQKLIKVN